MSFAAVRDGVESATPLVVRWGSFGDMVMITPVLKALAERCGMPVEVAAAGPWSYELYTDCAWVGQVYALKHRKPPYILSRGKQRIVATWRKRPWGPIWLFERHRRARELLERAGCPRDHIIDLKAIRRSPLMHDCEYFLQLAKLSPRALPLPPLPEPKHLRWHLDINPEKLGQCRQWLKKLMNWQGEPLIAVQVGNKRTMRWWLHRKRASNVKNWPDRRWLALIRLVLEVEPDARVLLTGAPAEARLTRSLAAQAKDPRVRSVSEQMSIPRLLALLSVAHSCISVDTGTAHAAAARDCPLVVLFGASGPREHRPLGAPNKVEILIGRSHDDFSGKSDLDSSEAYDIGAILPTDVLEAWQRIAARGSSDAPSIPQIESPSQGEVVGALKGAKV